jgi:hypothetical protein
MLDHECYHYPNAESFSYKERYLTHGSRKNCFSRIALLAIIKTHDVVRSGMGTCYISNVYAQV